jgi:hypothetical protein
MAVVIDDLRAGVVDVVRHDKRTIVAYLTGAALIATGVAFSDWLHFRGAVMMSIGGAFIVGAVFVPAVTTRLVDRMRPDFSVDLAEVYSTMHDALASQQEQHEADLRYVQEQHALDLREVREIVAEVRQLL